MPVDVLREPDNPADKNAVALFAGGTQIGYLSAESASWYAHALDSGEVEFTATLSDLYEFETDDERMLVSGRHAPSRNIGSLGSNQFPGLPSSARPRAGPSMPLASRVFSCSRLRARRSAGWTADSSPSRKGVRLFCNVYWSLIVTMIGLAALAPLTLRSTFKGSNKCRRSNARTVQCDTKCRRNTKAARPRARCSRQFVIQFTAADVPNSAKLSPSGQGREPHSMFVPVPEPAERRPLCKGRLANVTSAERR